MAVNVDLLTQTREAIKANPKHWDQRFWHCGTLHCVAGFAELIAKGLPFDTSAEDLKKDKEFYDDSWNTADNARVLLGISLYDATSLFAGGNTLEDIEKMVSQLIEHGKILYDDGVGDEDEEEEEEDN